MLREHGVGSGQQSERVSVSERELLARKSKGNRVGTDKMAVRLVVGSIEGGRVVRNSLQ